MKGIKMDKRIHKAIYFLLCQERDIYSKHLTVIMAADRGITEYQYVSAEIVIQLAIMCIDDEEVYPTIFADNYDEVSSGVITELNRIVENRYEEDIDDTFRESIYRLCKHLPYRLRESEEYKQQFDNVIKLIKR